MKIDRLIGILSVLLQKEQTTAPELFSGGIKVKALFAPEVKWRLVEEFGPECFTKAPDGRLLFTADYTDVENLVTWIMTFGAKAEVLEPEEVRAIIRHEAEEMTNLYMEEDGR